MNLLRLFYKRGYVTGRRLEQFKHVKHILATLKGKELGTFKKVKAVLEKNEHVAPGVSVERYTAMVLSMVQGNTTDADVIWH